MYIDMMLPRGRWAGTSVFLLGACGETGPIEQKQADTSVTERLGALDTKFNASSTSTTSIHCDVQLRSTVFALHPWHAHPWMNFVTPGRKVGYAAASALEGLRAAPATELRYSGPIVSGAVIGLWPPHPYPPEAIVPCLPVRSTTADTRLTAHNMQHASMLFGHKFSTATRTSSTQIMDDRQRGRAKWTHRGWGGGYNYVGPCSRDCDHPAAGRAADRRGCGHHPPCAPMSASRFAPNDHASWPACLQALLPRGTVATGALTCTADGCVGIGPQGRLRLDWPRRETKPQQSCRRRFASR